MLRFTPIVQLRIQAHSSDLLLLLYFFISLSVYLQNFYLNEDQLVDELASLKMLQWIFSKMIIMLTFGYYIRAILEMNQYLLISLTNELYYFHHSNTAELVSLVFAFFILFMCIIIILIVIYLIFKISSNVQEGKSMLGEFFSGVKLQRKFRLYVVFLLTRKNNLCYSFNYFNLRPIKNINMKSLA